MDGRAAPSAEEATGRIRGAGDRSGASGEQAGPGRPAAGAEAADAGEETTAVRGCTQGCFSSQAGLATFQPWPVEQAVAAAWKPSMWR